jgi:hypothetical protein
MNPVPVGVGAGVVVSPIAQFWAVGGLPTSILAAVQFQKTMFAPDQPCPSVPS